jgi:hypothetical protein
MKCDTGLAPRAGLKERAIMSNDIDEQRCIALSTPRRLIGEDSEGRKHYHDPALGVLWVLRDRETVAHAYQTRDLGGWRRYVAERCGWSWHNIDDGSGTNAHATRLREAAR